MAWEPTNIIREPWGRIQVIIGGEDVTFFRGVPIQVGSWSNAEPFGDVSMSIAFPQITVFEPLGTGDLSWLKEWADIEVYRVRPDNSVDRDKPLFEGMVASYADSLNDEHGGITIECIGALYQLDLYVRAPQFIRDPVYNEYHVRAQFSHGTRPNLRTKELEIEYPWWWGTEQDPNREYHLKDTGSPHGDNINMLKGAEIVQGYDEDAYGPNDPMYRGQQATVVANVIDWIHNAAVDYSDPPDTATDYFTDDNGTFHERNINRLAEVNIVQGDGTGNYFPGDPVLRDQTATYWDRALNYMGYPIPATTKDYFPDDTGNVHQGAINRLASVGIIFGYEDGTFRPKTAMTRAQAASTAIRVIRYISGRYLPSGFDEFGDVEGRRVTGEMTKWTGDWGKALTSFVQELLSYMQHDDDGVYGQFQWTIHQDPGRKPVMRGKDTTTVHWSISAGTPGFSFDLSHDMSQAANTFYGEGTDESGTTWRNAFINSKGSLTSYRPLAVADEVTSVLNETLHEENTPNPTFDRRAVRHEVHSSYGIVSLAEAIKSANRQLERDKDPGWYGTMTLRIDPEEGSRFEMRAGQNIQLKHYRGQTLLFHIAQVEVDMMNLTVSLTVDTKARDLLTIAEMIDRRARENKSPARLLRAGKESAIVKDERTPWDVHAGSGIIPVDSKNMQLGMENNVVIKPGGWDPTAPGYTPAEQPDFYVKVEAAAATARERWSFVPVPVQEYGSIGIAEMYCYTSDGVLHPIPFHWGLYGNWFGGTMGPDYMPRYVDAETQASVYDPFGDGVFDDPSNLDDSRIVLWGQAGQGAGYWPGLQSKGDPPTGAFKDEGAFDYQLEEGSAMWVAIYCDNRTSANGGPTNGTGSAVYFQGRLHKGSE